MISSSWSTRSLASSHRTRTPLPGTSSSPPGRAFRSRMAAATSPVRTVVLAHFGLGRLVDATYLGRLFSATPIGLLAISIIVPQEPAEISYVRRPNRKADAPP